MQWSSAERRAFGALYQGRHGDGPVVAARAEVQDVPELAADEVEAGGIGKAAKAGASWP